MLRFNCAVGACAPQVLALPCSWTAAGGQVHRRDEERVGTLTYSYLTELTNPTIPRLGHVLVYHGKWEEKSTRKCTRFLWERGGKDGGRRKFWQH